MQKFTTVTGPAVAVMRANIDTDVIVRVEWLTLPREQLEPYAFEALRYLPGGADDPDFMPNRAPFRGAPILLTGANFGCGSSRETAVWALQAMGIRCVIASSFGDIFSNNCFQNGVLPIVLPHAQVDALVASAADGQFVRVDLEQQIIITAKGWNIAFDIDSLRRASLLAGLDEIGLTLREDALIRAWQKSDRTARPWVWNVDDPQTGRIDLSQAPG